MHELMYQIFERHLVRRPDIYKQGDPYTLEQFHETLINKDETIILIEENQTVIGMCHMVKREIDKHPMLRPACIAYIEDFCVHKDYRRKGVGKTLYEQAIRQAELWDADTLELNVWEVNVEARKFYDSVGLKPKSTRMEYRLK